MDNGVGVCGVGVGGACVCGLRVSGGSCVCGVRGGGVRVCGVVVCCACGSAGGARVGGAVVGGVRVSVAIVGGVGICSVVYVVYV